MSALIVALAFGVPANIPPNKRIWDIASRKAREISAPVYTQRDIPVDSSIEVVHTEEEIGNPPPTFRVSRGAIQLAIELEAETIWIACAGPHAWRTMRDFRFAVREARAEIEILLCEEVNKWPTVVWFSQESTQRRTQSPWKFWLRELFLRALPMWVYKRIAA